MKQWWKKFRSKHYWRLKFTHMEEILSSSYLIVWSYRTIIWNQLQRVNIKLSHEKFYLIESLLQIWSVRSVFVDVISKCRIVNIYTIHFEVINDLSSSSRTNSFNVDSLIIFRLFAQKFWNMKKCERWEEKKKKRKKWMKKNLNISICMKKSN